MTVKNPTKCIHCLSYAADITDDHVIPESWYPLDTPANTKKPTAPACKVCNQKLGVMEQDLGIRMWLCVDPQRLGAKGLREKAFRSLGIGAEGLSEKEKEIRSRYKKIIFNGIKIAHPEECMALITNHISYNDFPITVPMRITFPAKTVEAVAEKVIRGIEYRQKGLQRYIENPYKVYSFFVSDETKIQNVVEMMNKLPVNWHGTGFEIRRGINDEEKDEVLYRITMWGPWTIYGFISKRGLDNLNSH